MSNDPDPVPMVLFCPSCGYQHVDAPDEKTGWTNPTHRSHLCGKCGHVFRPADVPTNGVRSIRTYGTDDSQPPVRDFVRAATAKTSLSALPDLNVLLSWILCAVVVAVAAAMFVVWSVDHIQKSGPCIEEVFAMEYRSRVECSVGAHAEVVETGGDPVIRCVCDPAVTLLDTAN